MFWADDGLDTGPILLQRECDVERDDTVNTIYKRFLFPEGVKGTVSGGAVGGERVAHRERNVFVMETFHSPFSTATRSEP